MVCATVMSCGTIWARTRDHQPVAEENLLEAAQLNELPICRVIPASPLTYAGQRNTTGSTGSTSGSINAAIDNDEVWSY
jgi:hypothetical protein